MSIADKLLYLDGTKQAIKQAIIDKGVTVENSDTFRSYAAKIGEIQTTGWKRNPDWLPLPEITAADNRFVGLFLVFEGEYNQLTVWTAFATINFGDGTIVSATGLNQTHVYDYNSIASPVHQYYDGRNYKQVIVDIVSTNTASIGPFYIDQPNGINNGGNINFVDIAMSLQGYAVVFLSSSRKLTLIERLRIFRVGFSNFPSLNNTRRLADLFIDPYVLMNNPPGGNSFRLSGLFDSIQEIKTPSTYLNNMFFMSKVEVMHLEATSATQYIQAFYECRDLIKSTANLPSAQNISYAYSGCTSLRTVELYGLGNVVSAVGIFGVCNALTRVILEGLRIGFSIANNNLTAQALNDLFDSLGTASGSQTIIVTGNPGEATCDTTIATAKGFTVIT